jgi:hypothetical protein
MLQAATTSFERAHDPAARPALLLEELRDLMAAHPELQSASVYRPGRAVPVASVGDPAAVRTELRMVVEAMSSGEQGAAELGEDGHSAEALVTPLADGGRTRGPWRSISTWPPRTTCSTSATTAC